MDVQLSCPEDGSQLFHGENFFKCPHGHIWKIRNSIPRFLNPIDENWNYSSAFGFQWQRWRKTQLDSYTGLSLSRERLRRCLGERLVRDLSCGKPCNILEAGCGAGRFTEILLDFPATSIYSVDYSLAVEANKKNFPIDKRHFIFQSDIDRLPFAPYQFDVVFCLGVVQHTPSPQETIAKLYKFVKPGGALVFDHYAAPFKHYTWFGRNIARSFLKRMDPENALKYTNRLVDIFFPFHRIASWNRFFRLILARVSPILTHHFDFPELNEIQQLEWSRLDTYDSLTDWYKHHRSKNDIRRMLKNLDAEDVIVATGGNGIEARCFRPSQKSHALTLEPLK